MDDINKFYIDFKNHKLVGDIIGNKHDEIILFLHGAGKSSRKRFETIRMHLYQKGFSSCAFDFTGHGETGGELSESSLYERTEQASRVIEYINNDRPLSIVAASMSGYTAAKLLQMYKVENLILCVPAAYDRNAYKLAFNNGFTGCIRKDKSYLNSDAWEIIRNFRGKLLIISAEKDDVIPHEVIESYYKYAVNVKVKKLITVKNSPHAFLGYMEQNRDIFKDIIDELTEILKL